MMGIEHVQNLAILPGAELVAVADPEPASLARVRAAIGHDVAQFADAAALMRGAAVDAVIVASPNFTHRAVLEPLFDADVAILCK
ncbi:Gfo/Idh/MocA family oxidoreductase, partial [Streptomyces caniscabiei]|uniref:Gfo/Idh/MocA family oxidoreductase n=1 Tax=Streptomyces caniscabiei TaxID=2746961 RepID=UPI0038F7DE7A